MMNSDLLSLSIFSLYVCLVWSEHVHNIEEVNTSETLNSTLRCTAHFKPGVRYSSLSWYKVIGSESCKGLLRSNMNASTLRYVDSHREMQLDENNNLLIPNVTCRDRGVYKCRLSAPVGEQNQEGLVLLNVTGCPEDPTLFLETTETFLDLPEVSDKNSNGDTIVVLIASLFLVLALILCVIIYKSTKNTFKVNKEKLPWTAKDISLDAPLKPLEKKDLMLIYTLGPKTSNVKQILV